MQDNHVTLSIVRKTPKHHVRVSRAADVESAALKLYHTRGVGAMIFPFDRRVAAAVVGRDDQRG